MRERELWLYLVTKPANIASLVNRTRSVKVKSKGDAFRMSALLLKQQEWELRGRESASDKRVCVCV